MARYSAVALAALLMLPMYGRAEELCVPGQQQARGAQTDSRGAQPDPGHKPPPKWWIDPQLRQQLAITDVQSKLIEDIWEKSLPDLRKLHQQLTAFEDQVSQMIQDGASEAAITAQIEQTENTRAQANKTRTLMVYRMYEVLTPDQRAKVKAMSPPLYDHRDGRRGGGPR